ncbi:MAG: RNA pseudouridine synthase [Treponema sp.]|jgi:23S rRNA pseudouridine1911/1915/1917 synthase|nr:RNA pseudouridine synthase [Treponema sp.]
MGEPILIDVTETYLVINKPPKVHSVPLREGGGEGTLLQWAADRFPEILDITGQNPREGGMFHRLDYETGGLVLIARTQAAMNALRRAQGEGRFVKEYEALSLGERDSPPAALPGFPRRPLALPGCIESAFRPYGPGRKAVRPVLLEGGGTKSPGGPKGGSEIALDRGKPYRTEILSVIRDTAGVPADSPWESPEEGLVRFSLRICRGFRHQIRCHLAWTGFPLVNDGVYGGAPYGAYPFLGLLACRISFPDPVTGATRPYRIP